MSKENMLYLIVIAGLFLFAIYAMLRATETAVNMLVEASKLGNGYPR